MTGLTLIDRRRALAVILMVDVALVLVHAAGHVTNASALAVVDLDSEVSIPTWWQQTVLVGCAGLAWLASKDRPDRRHWLGLAAILTFVSIDEGSEIHERLIDPMRNLFGVDGGILWFAWLIPGLVAVALFGATFLRFWLRLEPRIRWPLALAGCLYLVGAVGFEMVGGAYESSLGVQDGLYSMIVAFEEGFEMLGQAVLVYALLTVLVPEPSSVVLMDRYNYPTSVVLMDENGEPTDRVFVVLDPEDVVEVGGGFRITAHDADGTWITFEAGTRP